jgi:hypothetical protein
VLSSPDYVRVTGLSSGSHTIRLECTVAGTIWFDYFTTPATNPPLVVLLADPYLADYSAGSPFNAGSDAAIDAFKARLQNVAALYPTNEVVVVDTNVGWDKTTMIHSDTVHPNDRGCAHIAGKVADAMNALDFRKGVQLVG